MRTQEKQQWVRERIVQAEIDKYIRDDGRDYVDDASIRDLLRLRGTPDATQVRELIAKALEIQTLSPAELSVLMRVESPALWEEMRAAAGEVKHKVYDNRMVTFAPLYLSSKCVNNCLYCGLRSSNEAVVRRVLSQEEVRRETEALAGRLGHKRLIVVYGEHPESGVEYMAESIRTVYDVRVPARKGIGQIRRVNVNAAPMSVAELKMLAECGLGTFQVFQETYDRRAYAQLHPAATLKGNFRWRLYAMHRAQEAGIDDNGIGVLYGLSDWRFELLAQQAHVLEMERFCGIGPHTLSFPRLEPAVNTPFVDAPTWRVSDEDFEKIVVLGRLAVPYAGLIITARESPAMRRRLLPLGVTQMDAASNVGVGAYADGQENQREERQQFVLGDPRGLDDVIREWAQMGSITSFCTAGYRCGRTGKCIMDLLRSGAEGKFCKLNAVLTFKEWLDDFATPATQAVGQALLQKELAEIQTRQPQVWDVFSETYRRIEAGERDLYF
ncbi:MAG: [FeFe] hydrogenase H-cluster radical SAM maturase HydG [Verrucomicrobiota bacterium]|jgi:2-iminoacetate synthase|nr:[FeFe] hydrogenase H-cluster radical SAM maturase HydG [Verrucomicrobiota bacterium]